MELQGKKTFLREIEEGDLDTVLRWRNSEHVRRVMFSDHKIESDEHRRWFDGLKDRPDYKFFIICDDASQQPVGIINWTIDREKKSCEASVACEIGIYIGEEEMQGKGHAGDAIEVVVAHLFEKEGVSEIITQAFAFNPQAVRFYEKHGFRADESLTWQYEKGGKMENVFVMKRLKEL